MKKHTDDRYPSYCPPFYRAWLKVRKIYRQTLTRLQERAASKRPLDPLFEDGEAISPDLYKTPGPNPIDAVNKCAGWMDEDMARSDVKEIVDQFNDLKKEMTGRGLFFTSTAGTFVARTYHDHLEWKKLWENAWIIRHAEMKPGYKVLDIGGASTTFSFYLARLGYPVVVVDNDWANCGTLFNARYVAKQMDWDLKAIDHDIARTLPFPDNHFDRVFSICVLEHLPCLLRQFLMKEIARVLKPGAVAGFTIDYDAERKVLVTDKGLRFGYKEKLERDVIRPSGMELYGKTHWADTFPPDRFLGALFLRKPAT